MTAQNARLRRCGAALLCLVCAAVMVRSAFVGLEIDEEYALSLGFRLHENRQKDTAEGAKPLSRSGSWLVAALITALFFGYVLLMNWRYNDHAAALTTYAAVIGLFLLLALVARLRERKQQAA